MNFAMEDCLKLKKMVWLHLFCEAHLVPAVDPLFVEKGQWVEKGALFPTVLRGSPSFHHPLFV